ncbi:YheT family hydrolase [Flavilitoribacter nigricans]|uniref:Alpha/beta hydrolase n=1 Tax=Flavilitoribacter nigricans (strain ATCC 23147 / DSM 23189 / NBRC 102662 / NCIMB 1420 / SS-2) TaxID=1122177 RepID=A0A2D0NI16_FLAN2|nr:alpha/beta fold hydrolase [Flavilitoribacter nigricans]PHN08154.1 alpha/beta hydrolase [Flavilitoribacter nigricans DSM 23189 = NBRC 102662]
MDTYRPALVFRNHHIATVYPSLFRRVRAVRYERERLTTPDDDFIDLDWSRTGSKKLVIGLHGLEGSSESQYIKGLARIFNDHRWDVVAMNFRSCSGEVNRQRRMYHSGETTDLDFVLKNLIARDVYEEIALVGFSLGGNVALKYTGEQGGRMPSLVKKVVGVSVPMELHTCSLKIEHPANYVYIKRFMNDLKRKFRIKQHLYPDIDASKIFNARGFSDFDEAFTAPVHGFTSAQDYWKRASSLPLLPRISVPTLIINAQDDSFLSDQAYPYEAVEANPHLQLLVPQFGGHVGFHQRHPRGYYWTEERILEFVAGKQDSRK